MRPQFSVIIPLYNKSGYIKETLASVIKQTVKDIEIIVVDDGSSDNSVDQVNLLLDERINLIKQSNKGVSAARNTGSLAATAPYIAYLDADDLWTPNHLEIISDLIKEFPNRGIYSCAHAIVHKGNYKVRPLPGKGKIDFSSSEFINEYSRHFSLVNSSTACISKKVFTTVGGFPVGVPKGEDVIVWLKAALEGGGAFDNAVCTIINRDAINRSSTSKDGEIAYYLKWIDNEITYKNLNDDDKLAILNLANKATLLNGIGSLMAGDLEAFKKYRSLNISKSGTNRIFFLLASIAPRKLLFSLQNFRHYLRKSYGEIR